MSHLIQQIRDAMVTQLTGLATTGARVYSKRAQVQRLKTAELPALFVGLPVERIDYDTIHFPPSQRREMDLPVVALVKEGDDAESTLTAIQAEVEVKLYSSQSVNTLGGLVARLNLTLADPELDPGIDLTAGQLTMNWNALYFTAGGAPQTAT